MNPSETEVGSNKNPHTVYCKHFVHRKKRFCRVPPKEGEEFCCEHKPTIDDISQVDAADKTIRIVCPLDRKHTCYAHNLKKHLKICNARKGVLPSFITEGVNLGKNEGAVTDISTTRLLSAFPSSDIKILIDKVNKIHDEKVTDKVTERILKHGLLESEIAKPEYGDKTKKHLKQASSILGLLDEYKLLVDDSCFIEFGAGRGQLSCWIAIATEMLQNIYILLIERASPKHKRDNKLNKTNDRIQRIRADIANLVLDKLDAVNKTQNIVGVTKHLCGDATDLAMRCMMNVEENRQKVSGLIMTFCCHHRCRWISYVGKTFFKEVGLHENDFQMMCSMASWATCGTGFSRERRKNMSQDNWENEINFQRDNEIGLTRKEKEEVGKKCKNILNWGRLRYLEDHGFTCNLHYYVDTSVSLENACIVAQRKDAT